MLGLRTQESDDFVQFFSIVQQTASDLGAIFFLDTGEGHDKRIGSLEAEDLSGWLVPKSAAADFKRTWSLFREDQTDTFDSMYRFANWSENNGRVIIKFTRPD